MYDELMGGNPLLQECTRLRALNSVLKQQLKETQEKLNKAVACIDETLAIIAHVDPDTYNNREALTMVGSVNMKTYKEIKEKE